MDDNKINVSWVYSGEDALYHVLMDSEEIFSTKDEYKRDMFIAELKAKIKIVEEIKKLPIKVYQNQEANPLPRQFRFIKSEICRMFRVPHKLIGKGK